MSGLHISLYLNLYLKFLNLLEDECHGLDIKIAGKMAIREQAMEEKDFNKFIENGAAIYQNEKTIGKYFYFFTYNFTIFSILIFLCIFSFIAKIKIST